LAGQPGRRGLMNWRWRYHLSLYFRNSLWILPALSILVALATVSLLTRYEQSVGSYANVSVESVRVIMSTVAGSTFTLVVLVSSAVLVAIQLASAQLTPRIISMVYRTPYQKLAFAVFVYTFTFSVSVLARIDDSAPRIASYLPPMVSCSTSLCSSCSSTTWVRCFGRARQ